MDFSEDDPWSAVDESHLELMTCPDISTLAPISKMSKCPISFSTNASSSKLKNLMTLAAPKNQFGTKSNGK